MFLLVISRLIGLYRIKLIYNKRLFQVLYIEKKAINLYVLFKQENNTVLSSNG